MNMTVVAAETAEQTKPDITFDHFKALADKKEIRKEIMNKTLEMMQANMIKLDEEVVKKWPALNSEPYVLQAYYNEKKTLLAIVRCKKDETRTPESVCLTSLETADHNNTMHVYDGPEDYQTQMCAFYHNPVTNRHDWALDAGLLDPEKHKRIGVAKIA